jgi:DNA processing protein
VQELPVFPRAKRGGKPAFLRLAPPRGTDSLYKPAHLSYAVGMTELAYWLAVNAARGVGTARVRQLLDAFGDLERAWRASPEAWRAAGLDRRAVEGLLAVRAAGGFEARVARLHAVSAHALTWDDDDYPACVRATPEAPPVLFVRGSLDAPGARALAVVGTRQATPYGGEVVRRLVGPIAAAGVTIVSGLARGIDGEAHRAALDAGGRTIAVLGHGVDQVYPPEHRRLAERIAARGALVSDYAIGTPPEGGNFPPRNRIISALAQAVLVVEATQQSGALITVAFALAQGRDVFAAPGPIFAAQSAGPNGLIQAGAKLVCTPEDILDELDPGRIPLPSPVQPELLPSDPVEAALLGALSREPMHVDDLARAVGLPIAAVSSALVVLELAGRVRGVGGMCYVRG